MLPENIIFIVILLSFFGHLSYLKSIIRGQAKPNLVSWFIWVLAPLIGVFFQYKAGAGLVSLPVFMDALLSFVIIITAILTKNGYWKINAFDLYCGFLALMALIFYVLTHNLGISILFAILSDALAATPTLIKTWKFPETETSTVYLIAALNSVLGLLIVKNWIFSIYSFNIYFVLINLSVVFCIYRKKIFKS
ncbi:MAG: hypothetical protein PHT16_03200 [Candidatus Pacebacteria bacterium]|nr:hypothetical protein [Candidatus Paceibacterota bacterium]